MLTRTNAVASAILAILVAKMNDEEFKALHIEPYLNGRECGYAIDVTGGYLCKNKFVFSRNRNSDDIVLYVGKDSLSFSMSGNTPDEKTYEQKTFFKPDEYVKVVDFILNKIRN